MDELLDQLQQLSVTKSQADAAQEQLMKQFSRCNGCAKLSAVEHVQALVCGSLLNHGATAAAAAAAVRMLSPSNASGCFTSLPVQQEAVLSAVARLLHGKRLVAQAATHLLLSLTGQGVETSCNMQADRPAEVQCILSHKGIMRGLVQQLARGDDTATPAAALLLARASVSGDNARVANQLIKSQAALSNATDMLQQQGSRLVLADAAAQLLHAVAGAGPEAAQAVVETKGAVAALVSLLFTCSRTPQQADPAAITAAASAARALCSIMHAADASVRWRVAHDEGVVAALLPLVKTADNAVLQEQALDVLLAAASKGESDVCHLMASCPTLANGLSRMLPGGTAPLQAAQDLAVALAANSPSNTAAQFTVRLMKAATQMPPYGVKAVIQQLAAAAAEQSAWVLSHLQLQSGRQQLSDAMAPLLPAPGAGSAILSVLRVAVANNLGIILAQAPSCSRVQEVVATALSLLVQSAGAEEMAKMTSSANVVRGLAHYLQHTMELGPDDTLTGASSWGVSAAPASAALLQLAFASKLQQPAALIVPAPASTPASSEASLQSWLAANSGVLQQVAASGWGSLSVTQLAAIAQEAEYMQAQQQQQLQEQLSTAQHGNQQIDEQKKQKKRQARLEQGLCSGAAGGAAAAATAGMYGAAASQTSKKQRKQRAPSELSVLQPLPADHTKKVQRREAAAGTALLARQSHDTSTDDADQSSHAAPAAAGHSRRSAVHAAGCCQRSQGSSAAFTGFSAATQKLIIDECGCIPPDQHLAAWQVAVQPFDSQQLDTLCSTYLRCNFAFGESWKADVRSQELVPMLQQLHVQAKAEQQPLARQAPTTTAVQPTMATMKLLRALRLLQHWDIVCPTQPGMPEPLRKMMQQAGCAAAGNASESDGDDDVQVVDRESAAEVDDDVEAQLQQLEDGDCDMMLVRYVPGRREQMDVQR